MRVRHAFVNPKGDGADATVTRPSDWNADHVIESAAAVGVHVNDFGAVGDNASHPLSASYGTLAAAQVDYPAAIALSDEKDWCAWQAASNFIYDRDNALNGVGDALNWSAGRIIADGRYKINRRVIVNHASIVIEGVNPGPRIPRHSGTSIAYNGPDGTIDAPIAMFDFFVFDELGAPPAGRKNNTFQNGTKVEIKNILFYGKAGNMSGSFDVSGFISGVRLRQAQFCKIENCTFGGTLYDGIAATAQQFLDIHGNFFYGVHRDAISIQAGASDFSTTVWISKNEFGHVGRYAILCDMMGSVEAMPIIRDNSFEHMYDSYFVSNPEWFVQGLPAATCFINAGNMLFEGNRYEASTDVTVKFLADVHLFACNAPVIQNSIFRNLACSARSVAALRTSAASTFLTANGYLDITNQRNYNCGTAADFDATCDNLTVKKIYNFGKLISVGDRGLGTSGQHTFEDIQARFVAMPTTAGAYATVVQLRATALAALTNISDIFVLTNSVIVDLRCLRSFGHFNQKNGNGDYYVLSGANTFGQWAANTAYFATMGSDGALRNFRAPLTENGFFYQCIVAGTSHATTEPVWPTTIGNTIVDGTVTWKCVGICANASEDNVIEWQLAGKRNRSQAAAPTTGFWSLGDRVWYPSPVAAGYQGKVCTASGTPGTWKGFGLIEA